MDDLIPDTAFVCTKRALAVGTYFTLHVEGGNHNTTYGIRLER